MIVACAARRREGSLERHRFHYGFAAIVLLVVLRMFIGWHFYREGISHYQDPKWSSEGFLRSAKGPLAEFYHSQLEDPYAWYQATETAGEDGREPYVQLAEQVAKDWEGYRREFSQYYGLTQQQEDQANQVYRRYKDRLDEYLEEEGPAIQQHLLARERWLAKAERPVARELPFEADRVTKKERELASELNGWKSAIAGLEGQYRAELREILDENDRARGPLETLTSQQQRDRYVTYGLIGIGGCLLVGLFTRLAAVLGGLFLISVILSQPVLVGNVTPAYYQFVEMLALFSLAATPVGRWAGLDFFIHHLIFWPFRSAKAKA